MNNTVRMFCIDNEQLMVAVNYVV